VIGFVLSSLYAEATVSWRLSVSLFDDMSRFLEARLDEFLKTHPTLELQVLDDQLQEQETITQRSLQQLIQDEKNTKKAILDTAEDVKRWHERISKAEQAGRRDLVTAAQEREAAFLRQGNQQWAHMELVKRNIQQTQVLLQQIRTRREELQAKIEEQRVKPPQSTPDAWKTTTTQWSNSADDPLEETFKRWELEEELETLKRRMGR
jgi:uncharacterized protein (TIGR04376 family)